MAQLTRRLVLAIGAAAALAGCQTTTATSATNMNADDLAFVTDAFNIIQFDRDECGLAMTQAKTPEVRAIAAQFMQEAEGFAAKLKPIADQAGVKPPTVLRRDLRVRAARLRLGQGLEFDRSFIEDQIVSHQDTLNLQAYLTPSADSNSQLAALSTEGNELVRKNLVQLQMLQAKMRTMKG